MPQSRFETAPYVFQCTQQLGSEYLTYISGAEFFSGNTHNYKHNIIFILKIFVTCCQNLSTITLRHENLLHG
jgi:hypothetical protein